MSMWALALRNLLRNRRRSITTLLALVIGVQAILLFGGYSRNINYGLQTDFVQSSGHFQLQKSGYFLYGAGSPVEYGISNYPNIIRTIKNDPVLRDMVKVVTPILQFGGIAGNFSQGVSRTIFGVGLVPEEQNQLRQWNEYNFPNDRKFVALSNTGEEAAVIGTGVARVLRLCVPLHVDNCAAHSAPLQASEDEADIPDDIAALSSSQKTTAADTEHSGIPQIEVLSSNMHGAPNVAKVTVVKAENMGIKEFDDVYIGMHLSAAQRLVYGNSSPQVTSILIQLTHTAQMAEAKARLDSLVQSNPAFQSLDVIDFETLNPFYRQAITMFGTIFGFIFVLIGAIVLFTISNTMSMVIIERTVEIGTLRAMGLRKNNVRNLFVCEGLILGLFGVALGTVLALLISSAINSYGVTWIPPGRSTEVPLTVRVWGEMSMIVSTATALIFIAVFSAWMPARRASSMIIVDAIRHV